MCYFNMICVSLPIHAHAGGIEGGAEETVPPLLEQGGAKRRKEWPQAVAAADRQAGKSSARTEKEVGNRALTGVHKRVVCIRHTASMHV